MEPKGSERYLEGGGHHLLKASVVLTMAALGPSSHPKTLGGYTVPNPRVVTIPKQVSKPGAQLDWCFVPGLMVPELPLPRALLLFPIRYLIKTPYHSQGQSALHRFRIARDTQQDSISKAIPSNTSRNKNSFPGQGPTGGSAVVGVGPPLLGAEAAGSQLIVSL